MLPPREDPILTNDLQETLIRDDDAVYRVGARQDRALLDPNTGGRHSATTATVLRTLDGRLVLQPAQEPVYACRSCHRQPFSAHAINSCVTCRTIICTDCTDTIDATYCLACGRAERHRRQWQFLFSIA